MPSLLAQKKASSTARNLLKQQEEFAVKKKELEAKWKVMFEHIIEDVWGNVEYDRLCLELSNYTSPLFRYQDGDMSIYDDGFRCQFVSCFLEYAKGRGDICCTVQNRYDPYVLKTVGANDYPLRIIVTLKVDEKEKDGKVEENAV